MPYLVVFVSGGVVDFPDHFRSGTTDLSAKGKVFTNRIRILGYQRVFKHRQHFEAE